MLKTDDLRTKTESELREIIIMRRRELMNLRFQRSTSQITSHERFRQARREIAQTKTFLRQKQLQAT